MSENTATETVATESEAPAAPVRPSNPMVALVQDQVTLQIQEANALVTKINGATTDKGKLVHDIRNDESVTDEKVRAFQEWHEKASAAINAKVAEIDEYIKANLLPKSEDVDVDALKAQHKTLKDGVKAALTFVQTVPGFNAEEFKVPDLANLRGGTSAGTGQGGKRPRLNKIWVNDTLIEKASKNAKNEDVMVSNFTLAAAAIGKLAKTKVETKDLQRAAFEAAGTDDLSTVGGKVFEFYFEAGTGDDRVNVKVAVEPKGDTDDSADEAETPAETPAE